MRGRLPATASLRAMIARTAIALGAMKRHRPRLGRAVKAGVGKCAQRLKPPRAVGAADADFALVDRDDRDLQAPQPRGRLVADIHGEVELPEVGDELRDRAQIRGSRRHRPVALLGTEVAIGQGAYEVE